MRFVERERRAGEVDLPLVFSAVVVVAGGLAAAWSRLGPGFPPCVWKASTGLPCPTCGGTRMGEALLQLDLLGAFLWNPLLFLGLAGILGTGLVCLTRRLLRRPRLRLVLNRPWEPAALRIGAFAGLTLGWLYLVLKGV